MPNALMPTPTDTFSTLMLLPRATCAATDWRDEENHACDLKKIYIIGVNNPPQGFCIRQVHLRHRRKAQVLGIARELPGSKNQQ